MRKGVFYNLSDYNITKDGQVINKHNGHVVKPQINGKGYVRVSIGKKLMFVHRLVAELYVPNPDNKPQVNHKDGNKLNNNAENLEWVTNQENRNHAVLNRLHLSGEACPWAKLTKEDVAFIRAHKEINKIELAKMFNVSPNYITSLRQYRTWKD